MKVVKGIAEARKTLLENRGLNLDHVPPRIQAGIEKVFGEVRDLLIQIKEVVEARDMVLLGDLLQYELDPVADRWERAIQRVHDHAVGLIPAGAARPNTPLPLRYCSDCVPGTPRTAQVRCHT